MKINAINSINYMTKDIGFAHSVVPYPEYENAYHNQNQISSIEKAVNRISALFTPEITKKSQQIKDDINRIYDVKNQSYYYNDYTGRNLSVIA